MLCADCLSALMVSLPEMDRLLPGFGSRLQCWDETHGRPAETAMSKAIAPWLQHFPWAERMKVHAPWKLEDEGGHSFLPCISHPRNRMLKRLAYLPSCHWCSSSFTQLLITSVTQGPSVFSIRSTHRAKTPPDHVDPQHKYLKKVVFLRWSLWTRS